MKKKLQLITSKIIFILWGFTGLHAASLNNDLKVNFNDCQVQLVNGILTLENNSISRSYSWNNGNLITLSITDKQTQHTWNFNTNKVPDFSFPKNLLKAEQGELKVHKIPQTAVSSAHLQAEVTVMIGGLQVKRIFRIYSDCPAIAYDYYLRSKNLEPWPKDVSAVTERIPVPGKHWRIKTVQFFDITDRNNNLVKEDSELLRLEVKRVGNLLFADNLLQDQGFFILKEAPSSSSQLHYPGFDFVTKYGEIKATGIGAVPADLDSVKWTRCYGVVTGVTSGGDLGRLSALRNYQLKMRLHNPKRDDMIMLNTWGDRNRDAQIGEQFTIKEIEAAKRLGITHFQIDDGWQTGRSPASALPGGSFKKIWDNPLYWKPDPAKFPRGLTPVVKAGRKAGVEVCLWFNPSQDNSYENWEKDAAALIFLYKKYGIKTFKIDGVEIADKKSEINFRKMLDSVLIATDKQALFNLDVTAGRRNGYHYFNEYGNVFLENRYTDWANYYPYQTLRNLWMLSRYVPAQNMQIEFLNNFRNADKYEKNDLFAPSKVSFEYGFAITMMAQPLAWFEATGLPPVAFDIAPTIKKYVSLQQSIHKGSIFPIGQEPSGKSWTGFQSINKTKGFFLIFRENNNIATEKIPTWLEEGKQVSLKVLLGQGKDGTRKIDKDGEIEFTLPEPNSYVLYEYEIL